MSCYNKTGDGPDSSSVDNQPGCACRLVLKPSAGELNGRLLPISFPQESGNRAYLQPARDGVSDIIFNIHNQSASRLSFR